MTETVTVYTPTSGSTDSTGEPIPGTPTPETFETIIWPLTSDEIIRIGGNPVVTHVSIGFPHEAAVQAEQFVSARGESWQIVGVPDDYRNPFTGDLRLVANARMVSRNGN